MAAALNGHLKDAGGALVVYEPPTTPRPVGKGLSEAIACKAYDDPRATAEEWLEETALNALGRTCAVKRQLSADQAFYEALSWKVAAGIVAVGLLVTVVMIIRH